MPFRPCRRFTLVQAVLLVGSLLVVSSLANPAIAQMGSASPDLRAGGVAVITLVRQADSPVTDMAWPSIKCGLQSAGISYDVREIPWRRAQIGTESGNYDVFFVAARNAGRDKYADASVWVTFNRWQFVMKKDKAIVMDDPAFWQSAFAANLGTARYHWLEEQLANGRLTGVLYDSPDVSRLWRMFMRDRFDVVLENQFNLARILRTNKISKDELVLMTARQTPMVVYFGKHLTRRFPDILPAFNQAVVLCRNAG